MPHACRRLFALASLTDGQGQDQEGRRRQLRLRRWRVGGCAGRRCEQPVGPVAPVCCAGRLIPQRGSAVRPAQLESAARLECCPPPPLLARPQGAPQEAGQARHDHQAQRTRRAAVDAPREGLRRRRRRVAAAGRPCGAGAAAGRPGGLPGALEPRAKPARRAWRHACRCVPTHVSRVPGRAVFSYEMEFFHTVLSARSAVLSPRAPTYASIHGIFSTTHVSAPAPPIPRQHLGVTPLFRGRGGTARDTGVSRRGTTPPPPRFAGGGRNSISRRTCKEPGTKFGIAPRAVGRHQGRHSRAHPKGWPMGTGRKAGSKSI